MKRLVSEATQWSLNKYMYSDTYHSVHLVQFCRQVSVVCPVCSHPQYGPGTLHMDNLGNESTQSRKLETVDEWKEKVEKN